MTAKIIATAVLAAAFVTGTLARTGEATEGRQGIPTEVTAFGSGSFASPTGITYDARGGLFIAEWSSGRVSYVTRGGDKQLLTDRVPSPSGIALGRDGVLYIASYSEGAVYRWLPTQKLEVFIRGLETPAGLAIGRDGRLLIADRGLNQILRATSSGDTEVLATGLPTPVGVVQLEDGALVVSDFNGPVIEIRGDGSRHDLTRQLKAPAVGIVADGPDAVLVADFAGGGVWRVTRSGQGSVLVRGLKSPVALARSHNTGELVVGTWGDGRVRAYSIGEAK